jgi:hypothetical protein
MTSSLDLAVQQSDRRDRSLVSASDQGQLLSIDGAAFARPGPVSGGPSERDHNVTSRIALAISHDERAGVVRGAGTMLPTNRYLFITRLLPNRYLGTTGEFHHAIYHR